jgi:ABC-type bacteriocin/lantibiotic exporter with double-glycine peptidase domain
MENRTTLSPIRRFWMLLKPDRKEIKNVYIYAVISGLVNLSLPLGIQAIINLIQGGRISTSWIVLVVFVLLGIILSGLLQVSQLRVTENLQQKIFVRAAFEFTYRIPRIKLESLYKHYAPELMNRFFDVMSVQKGLSKILIDFSSASIQVIFGLILLSFYHPIFIVFSLILLILIYSIFKFTGKIGLETSLMESKYKYNVAHWLQEVARTNVTFKLAGETDLALDKTEAQTKKYIASRESHFSILVKQYYLMIAFKVLVAAGLLIMGGILVMDQQMNIGQFVAAEIIILLVLSSVEKLILSLEVLYDVLTSLEKIGQVTDLELERNEGIDIKEEAKEDGLKVEFENVDFCYPDQSNKILNAFSLKIEKGERLMIAGNNDSGKATLISLIAGTYAPTAGYIGYNDFPYGNINPITLRSIIGECLSSELLFEGTILENITMGRERASFENVQWAVKNLGLEKIIKKLPQGFDTHIIPQGQQFSKSVINKLLLARSIADKPKLLIVKDMFSNISQSEREKILDFITDKTNLWTFVIVSSENAVAKRMDKIAFLADGKLDKMGTYQEMIPFLNRN